MNIRMIDAICYHCCTCIYARYASQSYPTENTPIPSPGFLKPSTRSTFVDVTDLCRFHCVVNWSERYSHGRRKWTRLQEIQVRMGACLLADRHATLYLVFSDIVPPVCFRIHPALEGVWEGVRFGRGEDSRLMIHEDGTWERL